MPGMCIGTAEEGSTDSLVGRVFIFGAGKKLPRMRTQGGDCSKVCIDFGL